MRPFSIALFLLAPLVALCQPDTTGAARPLVLQDAIGLQLSRLQVFNAALDAWTYTFGQEPGAQLILQDKGNGLIEGTARVNYRSSGLGAREQTLGVIIYHITVQAENGQCRVRVTHFIHTGNANASSGAIDLGPIYESERPMVRIRGISLGTAQKLHDDMRDQANAQVRKVMNAFAARIRMMAASTK